MSFVSELREELLAIERSPFDERSAPDVLEGIDVVAVRRACLELYDQAETNDTLPPDPNHARALFDPKLFAQSLREIVRELTQGLCDRHDLPAIVENARLVWGAFLRADANAVARLSRARRQELVRISRAAIVRYEQGVLDSADIDTYCFEMRLMRSRDVGRALTPIARTWLSLAERDAVAWLLWIESKLALGSNDRVRVSRELAVHLTQHAEYRYVSHDDAPDWADDWPFPCPILTHLVALGVVDRHDPEHAPVTEYTLVPVFRPVLVDIAEQRQTPLSLVIDTMLAADRDEIISRTLPTIAPALSAAEAQSQHAKMVVHELRNVLTPMKATLSTLHDRLETPPCSDALALVERLEQSVNRLFHYADDLGRYAAVAAAPPGLFELAQAVRDAIASLNGGVNIEYELELAEALPRVRGYRDRFTLVVINLLRNAAQVSMRPAARVRVSAALSASMDAVRLAFEDDGPGVDEALREVVFQPGFSQRSGGTGQGLALVRQVVEAEMQGKVQCTAGALGGALFELVIPAARGD